MKQDIFEGTEKVYEEIKAKFAKAEQEEEGLLIHGDFWTGNILLHDTPLSDQALPVYVIDWELSHLSKVSFDLGQMFAELFQLTHFKKIEAGVWLIESFMDGYGKIDEDLAFETVVHVGTHFICFGSRTAGWGTEEQVRRLVEIGRDFMVKGWARDREFFEGTALKCLFR
jgi:thiamine kinase-like enzyme